MRIEKPDETRIDAQMEELMAYMVAHDQLLYFPVTFVQAWLAGKLKVLTHRDEAGKITGMQVLCFFTCPVTGKAYYIESFRAGDDLRSEMAPILAGYQEVEDAA